MSKGNMLLGHARGKVGDLVFSRVNGQQITRARAAVVKNPQTEKQMIQRILLNTVILAYSRMSEITDHSFEGVSVGQASMNKFMKENLNALRKSVSSKINQGVAFDEIYAFAPKGVNIFTPNPWILSMGQLPSVSLASITPTEGAAITLVSAGEIPTYGEIIASLGLQRGDQLTFIGQELYTDARAAFKFARVILDPKNEDGTDAALTTPFLANGVVNLPSPRNEGADIRFASSANSLTFDLGVNSMYGAAVIVSRQKSDGSWLRSNTEITLADEVPYVLTGSFDLQGALDYSMSGGIEVESDLYLNNATKARKIVAAPTPSPTPTPTPGVEYTLSWTLGSGISSCSVDGAQIANGGKVEAGKSVQVALSGLDSSKTYTIKVNNGTAINVTKSGTTGSASFTMPSANATISVQSSAQPSPGTDQIVTWSGNEIAKCVVDGQDVAKGGEVEAGKQVTVHLQDLDDITSYTIRVNNGQHIPVTKSGSTGTAQFTMPEGTASIMVYSGD